LRQSEEEGRPTVDAVALNLQFPAQGHGGEGAVMQTEAVASLFGCKAHGEDTRERLGRYAYAVVGDKALDAA
jgi:hypothetical protein